MSGVDLLYDRKLQGSNMGSNHFRVDMPRFVDLYLSGKLKLDDMISRRLKLEQINDAFEDMKRGDVARGVIIFESGKPITRSVGRPSGWVRQPTTLPLKS